VKAAFFFLLIIREKRDSDKEPKYRPFFSTFSRPGKIKEGGSCRVVRDRGFSRVCFLTSRTAFFSFLFPSPRRKERKVMVFFFPVKGVRVFFLQRPGKRVFPLLVGRSRERPFIPPPSPSREERGVPLSRFAFRLVAPATMQAPTGSVFLGPFSSFSDKEMNRKQVLFFFSPPSGIHICFCIEKASFKLLVEKGRPPWSLPMNLRSGSPPPLRRRENRLFFPFF